MTRSACAALTAAVTCLVLSAPALAAPSCDDRPLLAGSRVMTRTMTMPSIHPLEGPSNALVLAPSLESGAFETERT